METFRKIAEGEYLVGLSDPDGEPVAVRALPASEAGDLGVVGRTADGVDALLRVTSVYWQGQGGDGENGMRAELADEGDALATACWNDYLDNFTTDADPIDPMRYAVGGGEWTTSGGQAIGHGYLYPRWWMCRHDMRFSLELAAVSGEWPGWPESWNYLVMWARERLQYYVNTGARFTTAIVGGDVLKMEIVTDGSVVLASKAVAVPLPATLWVQATGTFDGTLSVACGAGDETLQIDDFDEDYHDAGRYNLLSTSVLEHQLNWLRTEVV